MKKIFLLSAAAVLLLNSCKNDLDVTADWKETIVVYGLLNPNDTAQYIKINKAFLGEGNALQYAQVFDSTNYTHNEINAVIQKLLFGTVVQTIQLKMDTLIPKDLGIFSGPRQFMYKTNVPIVQDGSEYKIIVTNTKSGVSVNAKTAIVQDLTITAPNPSFQNTINLYGNTNQPFYKAQWKSAPNGRLHSLTIRFHYTEHFIWDSTQVADKYVDWLFPNVKSSTLAGGQSMYADVYGDNFYRNLANSIAYNPNVVRNFSHLEFIFTVAGEDLATYLDVLQASGNSFQETPIYSNVNGGVGLFGSRSTKSVPVVLLSASCLDSLKNGQYTSQLGFQ